MVKAKITKKIQQDPISVVMVILIFSVLLSGVLIYMHILQAREINRLERHINNSLTEQSARLDALEN